LYALPAPRLPDYNQSVSLNFLSFRVTQFLVPLSYRVLWVNYSYYNDYWVTFPFLATLPREYRFGLRVVASQVALDPVLSRRKR